MVKEEKEKSNGERKSCCSMKKCHYCRISRLCILQLIAVEREVRPDIRSSPITQHLLHRFSRVCGREDDDTAKCIET